MIKIYRTAHHCLEERETSCIHQALKITAVKKAERLAGKMLCSPQRSLLHYALLLEREAILTRWAPLMGQAHARVPANLPWCGVTCREVTGCSAEHSLTESSKAPGGLSGTASEWVFLHGQSYLTPLLKDQFKSSAAVLPLLAAFTTGAACGSPQCLKATSRVTLTLHVSSRQLVNMAVRLQGCLSLSVAVTQAGCRWDHFIISLWGNEEAGGGQRWVQDSQPSPTKMGASISGVGQPGEILFWLLLALVSEAVRNRPGVLRHWE